MKILAIETSCDETSVALIEQLPRLAAQDTPSEEGEKLRSDICYKVLSHETISQINLHREFGGVYPTFSRREHEKNLVPLLHKVLKDSGLLKLKTQQENLQTFANEVTTRDDDYIKEKLGNSIELLERYPDLKENVFDFFSKFELKTPTSSPLSRGRTVQKAIDYIAVTNGPGLPPALWVGVNFAKVISVLLSDFETHIPIYPINHMEGHIVGGIAKSPQPPLQGDVKCIEIAKIKYPAIGLLISGGHTELVLSEESGKYKKIGETQDDAVGEAFDKVARLLNLPYPGGPEISKLATISRTQNPPNPLKRGNISVPPFPRPMIHSKDLNFSFSGLKTHILYLVQKLQAEGSETKEKHGLEKIKGAPSEGHVLTESFGLDESEKIKIAVEFEEAVKDVLIYKTKKAIEETGAQSLIVGGGVASNTYLKENFEKLTNDLQIDLYYSAKDLATDNALMIALTCANQIENGVQPTEAKNFLAVGSKNYEWK